MSIVDAQGAVVGSYEYDPYGNVIAATGTLAEVNPLRYRGYVYDTESELYYLQSRYYDPELGRFLNADALISTGQGILGNNMFAYCLNNPVNYADYTGLCSYIKLTGEKNDCGRGDCPDSENFSPFTVSMGGIISFGIGPLVISIQIALVSDCLGESEIQISYSGPNIFSTSLPSTDEMLDDLAKDKPNFKLGISGAGFMTVTNAPSVESLHGFAYSIGGSVTGMAVEYNIIPDGNGGNYSGVTVATGAITPGFNFNMSNTVFSSSVPFSVFDLIEAAYDGVYGR